MPQTSNNDIKTSPATILLFCVFISFISRILFKSTAFTFQFHRFQPIFRPKNVTFLYGLMTFAPLPLSVIILIFNGLRLAMALWRIFYEKYFLVSPNKY